MHGRKITEENPVSHTGEQPCAAGLFPAEGQHVHRRGAGGTCAGHCGSGEEGGRNAGRTLMFPGLALSGQ